ncbi:hypothetical protein CDD83_1822 [Cordyceps sp. RAO-2017]|nr:hypothetical protein CDD83_1822 [Cordyceps sp. RAO-2017]
MVPSFSHADATLLACPPPPCPRLALATCWRVRAAARQGSLPTWLARGTALGPTDGGGQPLFARLDHHPPPADDSQTFQDAAVSVAWQSRPLLRTYTHVNPGEEAGPSPSRAPASGRRAKTTAVTAREPNTNEPLPLCPDGAPLVPGSRSASQQTATEASRIGISIAILSLPPAQPFGPGQIGARENELLPAL